MVQPVSNGAETAPHRARGLAVPVGAPSGDSRARHGRAAGETRCTVEQPTARVSGVGDPETTGAGGELDRALAALLARLDAPVPGVPTADCG